VYEILHDIPESEHMMSQALLLELNSYFTCKHVLGDAIATVGEHLEDNGRNPCEQALGLLAQAIGFWWNDEDTNEEFCIAACKQALQILNDSAKVTFSDPLISASLRISCYPDVSRDV